MAFILLILYESRSFFKEISWKETLHVLSDGSLILFLLFAFMGIISILVTAFDDFVVIREFQYKIDLQKIWKVSFIATAVNNVTGVLPTGVGLKMLL